MAKQLRQNRHFPQTMLYSGTDERVQVSVDGTPGRFVHDAPDQVRGDGGSVIGEYDPTGTVLAEHACLMPDTD